jgi:hypothetical protein
VASPPRTLPNFLVIGAMKAGTTSLYEYLRLHPQVYVPDTKELNFFLAEYAGTHPLRPPEQTNWRRGLDWYASQFRASAGATAIGEVSPNYTKFPHYPGAPERIHDLIPDVRLIYVVRHPLERLRSHYLHDVSIGRQRSPLRDVVFDDTRYIDASRYAMQIERFERFFDPDRILLLTSQELRSHPHTSVDRILAFLGVEPALLPRGARFEAHQTADKRVRSSLPYRALRRLPFRDRLPDTIIRRVRDRVTAPLPGQLADLPVEVDRRVRDRLAPDVEEIANRLPGDFDGWGLL